MATYTTTTKWLLRKITGSSDRSEIDDGIGALADDIDSRMAGYAEGTLAAIPGAGKAGRFYRTTDTTQLFVDTGAAWLEVGISPWAPGDLKVSWLTAAPAGWLVCDGSAVSRSTYAALYAAIGDSAGAGNGTTTFNVPDFRGRTFVMPDGSAARMASNDARGQAGGAERVTLATGEIPSHSHGAGTINPANVPQAATGGATYWRSPAWAKDAATLTWQNIAPDFSNQTMQGSTAAAGGGASHENMPPYLVGGAVLIHV